MQSAVTSCLRAGNKGQESFSNILSEESPQGPWHSVQYDVYFCTVLSHPILSAWGRLQYTLYLILSSPQSCPSGEIIMT